MPKTAGFRNLNVADRPAIEPFDAFRAAIAGHYSMQNTRHRPFADTVAPP